MTALSRYVPMGRQYLSAAVQNNWAATLMQYFAWATGRVGLFNTTNAPYSQDNDGAEVTVWSGYLLYTGQTNTFRCTYYHTAAGGAEQAVVTIRLNGVIVKTTNSGADGTTIDTTVDLAAVSGLALTPHTVYPLTLTAHRAGTSQTVNLTVDVRWLGLEYNPTYTAVPTFTDTEAFSPADINTIADAIDEIGACVAMPVAPTPFETRSYHLSDNTSRPVWRGFVRHAHDRLSVKLNPQTSSAGDGDYRIFVDGVERVSGDLTVSGSEVTRTLDLSAYGLARGSYYPVEIKVKRTGTSKSIDVTVTVKDVVEYAVSAVAPPPLFQADTVTSASDLNWYKSIIDAIHPGAPSPTAPCYYSQPAVRSSPDGRYYLRRQRQYLHWINDGQGTTEIFYGGNYSQSLTGASGQQDLTKYSTLLPGTEYTTDDSSYAQEWDYA